VFERPARFPRPALRSLPPAAFSSEIRNYAGGVSLSGSLVPHLLQAGAEPVSDRLLSRPSRRVVLAMAASLLAGASSSALAQGFVIRAIHVTGEANRDLARLAPMVAQQLARQLGGRYAPGARGGATLSVELTGLDLPVNTGGDHFFRHFGGGVDVLEGQVALIGPRGAAIKAFPLLASTSSTDASDIYMEPTESRLGALAYTYSYWLVGKLD